MKLVVRNILFIALVVCSVHQVQASRVSKGFEALKMMDYFKAKKMFTKGLKYNPEVSSYGLSIIFSRNDNPFYNLDSAYRYVVMADTTWANAKDRKKEKWQHYGWHREGIDSMMQVVSSLFFKEARKTHTVDGYTTFLNRNPWSKYKEAATESRDSLAFFEALQESTSEALDQFIETYPGSAYESMAEQSYHQVHYQEQTRSGTIESYLNFIENNSNSPMVDEAYEAVYKLSTASNRLEDYELFVLGYPDNAYNKQAWGEYYQLYISDYSKERMQSFLEKYAFAPIIEEVQRDIELFDQELLINAVVLDTIQRYGYMDTAGHQKIDYLFDEAAPFKDGLAMVAKDGQYGFIDKEGRMRVPNAYDAAYEFHEGRCVVEKEGKLGMIDRNNRLLLPFMYEDLGDLVEGRVYVSKGDLYGYTDENGVLIIPEKFEEAFNFNEGIAQVQENEMVGMINRNGAYVIDAKYEELVPLTDSIMLCSLNGKKGLLTMNGTEIIAPQFSQIGKFSDGLAIAAKGDTVVYVGESGEIVIDKKFKVYPNFLLKGEFLNGGAIVFRKKSYGRINTYGNIITDIKYENLGRGGNFIPFEKDEYWGLLSASNSVLVSAKYESLDLIDEKYLIVRMEDSIGVIDANDNVLIPFSFDQIEYLENGFFIVSNGTKSGLYHEKEAITEVRFDLIKPYSGNFVTLIDGGNFVYYDLKNKQLIQSDKQHE